MLTYAGIPSDTLTISDQTAYLDNQDISKGAWLLLAYADWSRYAQGAASAGSSLKHGRNV